MALWASFGADTGAIFWAEIILLTCLSLQFPKREAKDSNVVEAVLAIVLDEKRSSVVAPRDPSSPFATAFGSRTNHHLLREELDVWRRNSTGFHCKKVKKPWWQSF